MIAASHIVAGAATGALCRRAWIAVPVAFAGHFVLDQIPHSCFNALPPAAWTGWPRSLTYAGLAMDGAIILVAAVLAWRHPTRWVVIAAAIAAFAPDPLCYMPPLSEWFALLPGSSVVPWIHSTFHCDVTRTHCALGFATQVLVIGAGLWVLAPVRPPKPAN